MVGAWGVPTEMITPNEYTGGLAVWDDNQLEAHDKETEQLIAAQISQSETGTMSCSGKVYDYGNVQLNCKEQSSFDAAIYRSGRDAASGFLRICHVTAQFEDTGVITKVTARSKWCERDYGDNLKLMARPGTNPFPEGE